MNNNRKPHISRSSIETFIFGCIMTIITIGILAYINGKNAPLDQCYTGRHLLYEEAASAFKGCEPGGWTTLEWNELTESQKTLKNTVSVVGYCQYRTNDTVSESQHANRELVRWGTAYKIPVYMKNDNDGSLRRYLTMVYQPANVSGGYMAFYKNGELYNTKDNWRDSAWLMNSGEQYPFMELQLK